MKEKSGICHLSMIPMRKEPSERSELVSMLLFGEEYTVKEEQREWIQVITKFDQYKAWIDKKLFHESEKGESSRVIDKTISIQTPWSGNMQVFPGSELPLVALKDKKFRFGSLEYTLNQEIHNPRATKSQRKTIAINAQQYLNSSYLWGGRIPGSIDCSALVQIAFKISGIKLPRDSGDQAKKGDLIDLKYGEPGDLAFFENQEQKITHVGILLNNKQILHSSGYVRIDFLDDRGIFDEQKGEYTHRMHSVRKITE
ncbi:MAG: NlpC/P60 family protein [Bacteroidota bacterium]